LLIEYNWLTRALNSTFYIFSLIRHTRLHRYLWLIWSGLIWYRTLYNCWWLILHWILNNIWSLIRYCRLCLIRYCRLCLIRYCRLYYCWCLILCIWCLIIRCWCIRLWWLLLRCLIICSNIFTLRIMESLLILLFSHSYTLWLIGNVSCWTLRIFKSLLILLFSHSYTLWLIGNLSWVLISLLTWLIRIGCILGWIWRLGRSLNCIVRRIQWVRTLICLRRLVLLLTNCGFNILDILITICCGFIKLLITIIRGFIDILITIWLCWNRSIILIVGTILIVVNYIWIVLWRLLRRITWGLLRRLTWRLLRSITNALIVLIWWLRSCILSILSAILIVWCLIRILTHFYN
jgi:hypothetical protein